MSLRRTDRVGTNAKDAGEVFIAYETPEAREHAVRVCEQLARSSKRGGSPALISFSELGSKRRASGALRQAAMARIVIFAITADGDFPESVKQWLESLVLNRGEREGAVMGLVVDREADPFEIAALKEIHLRQIAHRAGMDYLSHGKPTDWNAIPDSLDSFSERAGQVTSVLDQILHRFPRPVPIL